MPEVIASVPSSTTPASVAIFIAVSGSVPLAISLSNAAPEAEENVMEAESTLPIFAAPFAAA